MARRSRDTVALTKDSILAAACAMVRAGSLSDLKTKAIGEALGVTQPAIYHYYADRGELVAAVVDRVCGEILARFTSARGSWEDRTRHFVRVCAETFTQYPGVANHLQTYGPFEPAARELVDMWMRMFVSHDFSKREATLATFHINQYLLGHFSWYESNADVGPKGQPNSPLQKLTPEDYAMTPYAFMFDTMSRSIDTSERLRDGVEVIISGFAERRAAKSRRRTKRA
jgi:AcrR family transcriptional regulator